MRVDTNDYDALEPDDRAAVNAWLDTNDLTRYGVFEVRLGPTEGRLIVCTYNDPERPAIRLPWAFGFWGPTPGLFIWETAMGAIDPPPFPRHFWHD
jgi:hypothetical protein